MFEKSLEIATKAHEGQTDKSGKPYIEHPKFVADLMPTEELKTIAILHDVVEDNPEKYSFDQLREQGFGDEIITPLNHLTRDKEENYWDYIRRVADNDTAIEVKLADLRHNADLTRISAPSPYDISRKKQYDNAMEYLKIVKDFKANNKGINLMVEPYKFVLTRLLFGVIRDDYVAMCNTAKAIMEAAVKSVCPSAIVQARAKKLDSFTEKCARKSAKYKNSNFKMMTDLCGIRVILQTTGQVSDFCEVIKKNFDVDWENSEDTGTRLGDSEFGYISQHFIVSFRQDISNILGVEVDAERFRKIKAEIQVRTLAQHIVADTLHDRMYKTAVSPLKEHKREAAVIAALLENSDAVVNRFVTDYDKFSLNQTSYMSVKKIEEELSILEAMNYCEDYIFTRFMNTLKIVGYMRTLGRHEQIKEKLSPFIKEYETNTLKLDDLHESRLCFEYGAALLAMSPNNPDARNYIKKALSNYSFLENDHTEKWLEARRFYAFMLVTAATLAPSEKKWLERALKIDSTNPYACAEILRHESLNRSLLIGAVSVAKKHLNAGINEPDVYFVLGRLLLAMGENDAAFNSYVDGLIFYISRDEDYLEKNNRVRELLEREMQYIDGETGICEAISDLLHHVYSGKNSTAKTVWTTTNSEILTAAAQELDVKTLSAASMADVVNQLKNEQGYLFMDSDNEPLLKAAIVLGYRIISIHGELNSRVIHNKKIRKTKRFYTLPHEKESLLALFTERAANLRPEQIESAAQNGHNKYALSMISDVRKSGKTPPNLGERIANWEALDFKYKNANFDKVNYACALFGFAGYELNEIAENAVKWEDIPAETQELMAKLEHGRWNAERVVTGWSYSPKRNDALLLNDNITAWDALSDRLKEYDYESIENMIDDFAQAGVFVHKKGAV
jgi:ppGpp synthetase/RelA/SpoT-type nucleotidyltranferase